MLLNGGGLVAMSFSSSAARGVTTNDRGRFVSSQTPTDDGKRRQTGRKTVIVRMCDFFHRFSNGYCDQINRRIRS